MVRGFGTKALIRTLGGWAASWHERFEQTEERCIQYGEGRIIVGSILLHIRYTRYIHSLIGYKPRCRQTRWS